MTKHANVALRRNSTLLIMSLKRSSDPVGVPTLRRYKMLLPEIVILVQLVSNFWGRTSQTTIMKEIYFLCSTGMFSRLMTKKVSEPATHFFLGTYLPLPTPCHRRSSSFLYYCFFTFLGLWWLRS